MGSENLSEEEFLKIRLFRHIRLLHYPVHFFPWLDKKGKNECETMRNLNSNSTLYMETIARVHGGSVGLINFDVVPIVAKPYLSELPHEEWEESKPAWETAMSAAFAFAYKIATFYDLVIMAGSKHIMHELQASEPFEGLVVDSMEEEFPQLAGIIPNGVPVKADVYSEHATGLTVTSQIHPCNPTPVTERLALVVLELCVVTRDLNESTRSKLMKEIVGKSFKLAELVHDFERGNPGDFAAFAAVARDHPSTAKKQLSDKGFCPSQCEIIISLFKTRSGKRAILENQIRSQVLPGDILRAIQGQQVANGVLTLPDRDLEIPKERLLEKAVRGLGRNSSGEGSGSVSTLVFDRAIRAMADHVQCVHGGTKAGEHDWREHGFAWAHAPLLQSATEDF